LTLLLRLPPRAHGLPHARPFLRPRQVSSRSALGLDLGLTAGADMAPAWETGMRALWQRWKDAIVLDITAG
jgi:hypothetical protein